MIKVKSEVCRKSLSHLADRAALIPGSMVLGQAHQSKLYDHRHGASVLHGAPVHPPAFAGTILMTEANVGKQLARGRTRQCSGWD